MPQATRYNKKAMKICYALIGKPQNLDEKPIFKNKKIEAQILAQDTSRVK